MPIAKKCSICQSAFECGAKDADSKCWCAELPHVVPYPANSDCLCPKCLKSKIETIEGYNAVSKTYADKSQDEILLKPTVQQYLSDFVAQIPETSLICDVGCGPGQVARYLKQNLHRKVSGIDLSPKMVEIATSINPEISFRCADILDMNEKELFGGIIGLYFIVNFPVSQLPLVFKKLHQFLMHDGKLLLSFHIGNDELHRVDDFWNSGKGMDFYFFKPETISALLTQAGFLVKETRIRKPDPLIEYESERAYIFATKK